MCNAHNHPENCDCGWGQKGGARLKHSKQMGLFSFTWPKGVPSIIPSVFSVRTPNSRCPVCHESVFYYCNEYGSSVFFDSLGPPWPKHPCTDSEAFVPLAIDAFSNKSQNHKEVKQLSEGWECIQIKSFSKISKDAYEINIVVSESEEKELYIPAKNIKVRTGTELFSEESIGFINTHKNGAINMSILSEQLTVVDSVAFESEDEIQ